MRYSVQVLSDLSFILCFENEKIPNSHVNSINKEIMNTCTPLNTSFNYLDSIPKKEVTDEEINDDIIQKLKDSRFPENKKISFLVEQLHLLFKKPNDRRCSPSMLAMAVLVQRISPACYKQLYNDGFLTLPAPGHLRWKACEKIAVFFDFVQNLKHTHFYAKFIVDSISENRFNVSCL